MQIVIDIPEEECNKIEPFLNGETIKGGFNLFRALEIIKNGTPLPKGHGRLIDADAYIARDADFENGGFIESMDAEYFNSITPTIIEADKEVQDADSN